MHVLAERVDPIGEEHQPENQEGEPQGEAIGGLEPVRNLVLELPLLQGHIEEVEDIQEHRGDLATSIQTAPVVTPSISQANDVTAHADEVMDGHHKQEIWAHLRHGLDDNMAHHPRNVENQVQLWPKAGALPSALHIMSQLQASGYGCKGQQGEEDHWEVDICQGHFVFLVWLQETDQDEEKNQTHHLAATRPNHQSSLTDFGLQPTVPIKK